MLPLVVGLNINGLYGQLGATFYADVLDDAVPDAVPALGVGASLWCTQQLQRLREQRVLIRQHNDRLNRLNRRQPSSHTVFIY